MVYVSLRDQGLQTQLASQISSLSKITMGYLQGTLSASNNGISLQVDELLVWVR
jgi:hypothetical protein